MRMQSRHSDVMLIVSRHAHMVKGCRVLTLRTLWGSGAFAGKRHSTVLPRNTVSLRTPARQRGCGDDEPTTDFSKFTVPKLKGTASKARAGSGRSSDGSVEPLQSESITETLQGTPGRAAQGLSSSCPGPPVVCQPPRTARKAVPAAAILDNHQQLHTSRPLLPPSSSGVQRRVNKPLPTAAALESAATTATKVAPLTCRQPLTRDTDASADTPAVDKHKPAEADVQTEEAPATCNGASLAEPDATSAPRSRSGSQELPDGVALPDLEQSPLQAFRKQGVRSSGASRQATDIRSMPPLKRSAAGDSLSGLVYLHYTFGFLRVLRNCVRDQHAS